MQPSRKGENTQGWGPGYGPTTQNLSNLFSLRWHHNDITRRINTSQPEKKLFKGRKFIQLLAVNSVVVYSDYNVNFYGQTYYQAWFHHDILDILMSVQWYSIPPLNTEFLDICIKILKYFQLKHSAVLELGADGWIVILWEKKSLWWKCNDCPHTASCVYHCMFGRWRKGVWCTVSLSGKTPQVSVMSGSETLLVFYHTTAGSLRLSRLCIGPNAEVSFLCRWVIRITLDLGIPSLLQK